MKAVFLLAACSALTPAVAFAGQTPSAPSSAQAPPQRTVPGVAPDITDTRKYPFSEAIKALESNKRETSAPEYAPQAGNTHLLVPSTSAARRAAALSRARAGLVRPGEGIVREEGGSAPIAEIIRTPLPENAQAALAVGDALQAQSPMPEGGKDGRVLFTYGVGLPTVICAPLRVCTIELQPGERITGEPEIGDSVRWEIIPAFSGSGEVITPVVVLKPHTANLDTNLVITTDKRTYYVRLLSQETGYIARTAFSYKDDEDARWRAYIQQQQREKIDQENRQIVTPMAGDAIERLNFGYEIKGGNRALRPLRIMDDGEKTYLTMPDATLHRELPALVVENPRLKGQKADEIVNYRVKGNLYIVDRLFDRAALIIGSGKAVDKVQIRRKKATGGGS